MKHELTDEKIIEFMKNKDNVFVKTFGELSEKLNVEQKVFLRAFKDNVRDGYQDIIWNDDGSIEGTTLTELGVKGFKYFSEHGVFPSPETLDNEKVYTYTDFKTKKEHLISRNDIKDVLASKEKFATLQKFFDMELLVDAAIANFTREFLVPTFDKKGKLNGFYKTIRGDAAVILSQELKQQEPPSDEQLNTVYGDMLPERIGHFATSA